MAYIGKQPLVGNFTLLDALIATTTDTYALTKDSVAVFPQTPANCIVSLNGVIQAPTDSYTISGSNIVFASALTGSDSIDFITVLGDVLSIGTPTDGTVTTAKLVDSSVTTAKLNDGSVSLAKLTATGTKDATTFLRGDNTFQTIGTNTPAFAVKFTSSYTLTVDTSEIVEFNSEFFDTDNAFDTTTHKFTVPTGKGGKYFFHAQLYYTTGIADGKRGDLIFDINGTQLDGTVPYTNNTVGVATDIVVSGSMIKDLSAGDAVAVYSRQNDDSSAQLYYGDSFFYGYKLIG
jgi:hypothetical protein